MKINLHKCLVKGFVYILLSVVATVSLYASQYNEPRKVLSAVYKNALYKNLTVPGEMKLDTKEGRTFLMEIGKRPTYFWSSVNAFHLLQTQTLTLNTIRYNKEVDNTFRVNNINIPNAFFISEGGMSFKGLELSNNEAGILVEHSDTTNMSLNIKNIGNITVKFNANNMSLIEPNGLTPENSLTTIPTIYKLKTRDLQINGINFVVPRMTITNESGVYVAHGTATNFELPDISESTGDKILHYYGDWEVVPAGLGATVGVTASCGDLTADNHETCRKVKKGDEGNPIWDDQASSFTCEGRTDAPNAGDIYDYKLEGYSDGFCYDYYIPPTQKRYSYTYDVFEFKVQEVFRVPKTGDIELIEQTPRFRIKKDTNKETAISKDIEGAWSIFESGNLNNDYNFLVNRNPISINGFTIVPADEEHPCLTACQNDGASCISNQLYIRNNRRVIFVDDSNVVTSTHVTHWSIPSEQDASKLAVVEYTIGVCPADSSTAYADYEQNFVANSGSIKMMNGMLIPSGSNFVVPKVCLRRQVKCNHGVNVGKGKSRYYKPLTTDY